MHSSSQKLENPPPHNRLIEDNNKRALELLLRIQSQLEATAVLSTATKKVGVYEV
jgi:hypothetical protein